MLGPKTQIAWQDKRALFKSVSKSWIVYFSFEFYFSFTYLEALMIGIDAFTVGLFLGGLFNYYNSLLCNNFLLVPSVFFCSSLFPLCSLLNYLYKSGLSFLSFQKLKNIFSPLWLPCFLMRNMQSFELLFSTGNVPYSNLAAVKIFLYL